MKNMFSIHTHTHTHTPSIHLAYFGLPGVGSHWPCHLHLKSILRPKEELWKLKYFTIAKVYLIFKKKKIL
jgi:hypothetical protein